MEIVLWVLGAALLALVIAFGWRSRRLADAPQDTGAATTKADGDAGLGYDGEPDGDVGGGGGGGGGGGD
jgi:hypothetical protein